MKQFFTIFGFEIKNFFKNKVFMITTIFLAVALAVVMFIPAISSALNANKADEPQKEKPIMLVSTEEKLIGDFISKTFSEAFPDYEVKLTQIDGEEIKKEIRDGKAKCAFLLDKDFSFVYYVDNLAITDFNSSIATEVLQTVYRMSAMVIGGLSVDQATQIMGVQINGKTENLGIDQMRNYGYTYIMILALYMVILLYGQMVATNVASEKSSRAMELLITSAKPTSMMFGKVFASCTAGLLQIAIIFGSAVIFYNINKAHWANIPIMGSIFDMPPHLIIYMLVFFVLGFLTYAFLYGAIGSTASKLEDINTAVTPLTFMFIFAFLVVMMSMTSGSVDNTLMVICSYIPFTSPMAMFARIAMSNVPIYEIALSITILIGSVIGIGYVSAKIYRMGVLLYGTAPKLGALLKAIKKA